MYLDYIIVQRRQDFLPRPCLQIESLEMLGFLNSRWSELTVFMEQSSDFRSWSNQENLFEVFEACASLYLYVQLASSSLLILVMEFIVTGEEFRDS